MTPEPQEIWVSNHQECYNYWYGVFAVGMTRITLHIAPHTRSKYEHPVRLFIWSTTAERMYVYEEGIHPIIHQDKYGKVTVELGFFSCRTMPLAELRLRKLKLLLDV